MWSVAYASMTFRTVDVGWVNFVFALLPCAFVMASPQMALAAEPSPDSDTVPAPAAAAGQPEVPPAPSYPPPPMAYPPPPPGYPPPPGAGYPPQYPAYPPAVAEEPEVPSGPAPFRPLRFRFDFGIGYFHPSQVNNYMQAQIPSDAELVSGFSEMALLFSLDFSGAYYFTPWFGLRANMLYLFSPKILEVMDGDSHTYWLQSLAPGLSLDFAIETGGVARFYASPGIAYQYASFEGYSADGVGLELALGADLSFGAARAKGISLALVFRYANLGVSSGPGYVSSSQPTIDHLDFTSLLLRVGFQFGI